MAVTLASGRRAASARAIAPVPVPTSTTLGAPVPASSARQRSTSTSVSGRGTSARASQLQLQPVEAPAAEHVGERLALAAAAHELAQAVDLGGLERAVVVEVELEPLDRQDVSEQVLGVEPRRAARLALQVLARAARAARGPCSRRCSRPRGGAGGPRPASACVNAERSPASTASRLCDGELDAVVGDAPLGIVVGADLLGALARADLGEPLGRLGGVALLERALVEARAQDLERALAVLDLRALVLAGDDDARRQVRDAHRGVGRVDRLAAGARSSA